MRRWQYLRAGVDDIFSRCRSFLGVSTTFSPGVDHSRGIDDSLKRTSVRDSFCQCRRQCVQVSMAIMVDSAPVAVQEERAKSARA